MYVKREGLEGRTNEYFFLDMCKADFDFWFLRFEKFVCISKLMIF